jgi:hypothetical protein
VQSPHTFSPDDTAINGLLVSVNECKINHKLPTVRKKLKSEALSSYFCRLSETPAPSQGLIERFPTTGSCEKKKKEGTLEDIIFII